METLTQFDSIIYLTIAAGCAACLALFAARGAWRWWKRRNGTITDLWRRIDAIAAEAAQKAPVAPVEPGVRAWRGGLSQCIPAYLWLWTGTEMLVKQPSATRFAPVAGDWTPETLIQNRRFDHTFVELPRPEADALNAERLAAQKPAPVVKESLTGEDAYEPAGTMPVVGDRYTHLSWAGTIETCTKIEPTYGRVWYRSNFDRCPDYRFLGQFKEPASEWRILKRPAPVARDAGETEPRVPEWTSKLPLEYWDLLMTPPCKRPTPYGSAPDPAMRPVRAGEAAETQAANVREFDGVKERLERLESKGQPRRLAYNPMAWRNEDATFLLPAQIREDASDVKIWVQTDANPRWRVACYGYVGDSSWPFLAPQYRLPDAEANRLDATWRTETGGR